MIRLRIFILAATVSFLSACNHVPAAAPPDASTQLQQIPSAEPGKFDKIDIRTWKNPYLIVKADSIALLDVSNNEEQKLKPEDLANALARLPQSSWPYGRVVAVTESGVLRTGDDILVRKNRALVAGTLRELKIYVNWIPPA
jgi:hypothetical protein